MLTIHKNNPDYNIVGFETKNQKLTAPIADNFKAQLYQLLDNDNKKIILDMENIAFIDSSGFGAIVAVYNHAKNAQLELSLCNIAPMVMNLIKITKLDQVFVIYNSVEDAMK
jgi:anti-sigma B factor antagonist